MRNEADRCNKSVGHLQIQLTNITEQRRQDEQRQSNQAPSVSLGHDLHVRDGDDATLKAMAIDPEGEALTYKWDLLQGPALLQKSQSPWDKPELHLRTLPPGIFSFQVTVTDSWGKSASASTAVTVRPRNSIGIDLGTTTSCIAHSTGSSPDVIMADPSYNLICGLSSRLFGLSFFLFETKMFGSSVGALRAWVLHS